MRKAKPANERRFIAMAGYANVQECQLITSAAETLGQSLSSFVLGACLKEAREVLAAQQKNKGAA